MCTKWFSDGDVHKYFNPYGTPYDAYINFMNVLSDFKLRVNNLQNEKNIDLPKQEEEFIEHSKKTPPEKTENNKAIKKASNESKNPNVLTIRKVLTLLSSEEIWTLYSGLSKNERKKIENYIGKKKWKEMTILKESGVKSSIEEKQIMKKRYKKLLQEHI